MLFHFAGNIGRLLDVQQGRGLRWGQVLASTLAPGLTHSRRPQVVRFRGVLLETAEPLAAQARWC